MWPETLILSAGEREQVRQALAEVSIGPYRGGFDALWSAVRVHDESLPKRLDRALRRFAARLGRSGAVLVRDVLPEVPDRRTPTVGHAELGSPVLGTEKYLLFLAGRVGGSVSFADWHGGECIQNLYPIPELRSLQCASNAVYLELHTETAFRPTTPLALSLLCLRCDPAGRALTLLCDLWAVIEGLDPETRVTLAEPKFCFARPDAPGQFTEPKPIVSRRGRLPRLDFAEAVTACDQDGLLALERLNHRIEEACSRLELLPGDLLLIDNTHMIHGRTSYTPRYDGTDRWLQRFLIGEVASVPRGGEREEPIGAERAGA